MRAVILERSRRTARHMARVAAAAGWVPEVTDDPGIATSLAGEAGVVIADVFDGDLVINALRRRRQLRAILLTAEPIRRALALAAGGSAIANICGRPDFDSPPSSWELLMVLRRLASPERSLELSDFLAWGAEVIERTIATSGDREAAVAETGSLASALRLPGRAAELVAELAHELLMNAMYGAPVDAAGRPKYAADRRAALALPDAEQPRYRIGSDGVRLAIQVVDPFGRLGREALFEGLARGLAGEQDRGRGGAGLGFAVCHDASSALFAEVIPGARTAITGVVDLELNLRELRRRARSLHYFASPGR